MSEAAHNARVRQEIIAAVTELFSDNRTPTQAERDATEKRLRKLLFGNRQLNPAERMSLEGQVWQQFPHDSPARSFLNQIGFLNWN